MPETKPRLLVAASGTGGHLFPAIAVAEALPEWEIEWLGVPDRLETTLVPDRYGLHTIDIEGFQKPLGLGTINILRRFVTSIFQVRQLLRSRSFDAVFTTGGYIAAPAIIAARTCALPAILHEANAIPGRVTRWLAPWCTTVAIAFPEAAERLGAAKTVWVSTPVRGSFRSPQSLELPIEGDRPLIVVVGGSQGAVAVNQLVRQCAPAWLEAGAAIVHLTGEKDPEIGRFSHPRYFELPFYANMAGLLQRADLAISRAGAGTLTELAVTQTPAILIPYPYAADNHQAYNAANFVKAGAARVYEQGNLQASVLEEAVLEWLRSPQLQQEMKAKAGELALVDSAERLAAMLKAAVAGGTN